MAKRSGSPISTNTADSTVAKSISAEPNAADAGVAALRTSVDALRADLVALARDLAGNALTAGTESRLGHELDRKLSEATTRVGKQVSDSVQPVVAANEHRIQNFALQITQIEEKLGAALAQMHRVDARTSDEALREEIRTRAKEFAGQIYREEFGQSVAELRNSFADSDDQLTSLRAFMDNYEPGGVPVLHAKVLRLQTELEQTLSEKAAIGSENARHIARVQELEAKLQRIKLQEGLDPAEIDRKLADLSARDAAIRGGEVLQSEIDRLLRRNDELVDQLSKLQAADKSERAAQVDLRRMERLESEIDEADRAKSRAESEAARARQIAREANDRAQVAEHALAEVQVDRGIIKTHAHAIAAKDELCTQLRSEIADLSRGLDLANLESSKARTALEAARAEKSAAEQKAESAKAIARDELSREWSATRQIERERIETWARREVELRCAEVNLALSNTENRLSNLEILLVAERSNARKSEADLLQSSAQVRALEAQVAGLQDARARLESEFAIEATANRKRFETQLSLDAEHIRAEARRIGEEEAAGARQNADRLTAIADAEQARLTALEDQRLTLGREMEALAAAKGALEVEVEEYESRVNQLRGRDVTADERIASLRAPIFLTENLPETDHPREEAWLEEVESQIKSAGFTFHPRLIRAFHTSLKVADLAPLTVLAGISGTGKSELPRLYADVGGIPLLELPVQPSWDSPQDLFGFFNYTDGRLKAEPLSRLFRQVMDESDPLRRGPVMVLLDEMNLARVEYYFADLLSKLESRRGAKDAANKVARSRASITLDVGPGHDPIALFPDERILFVGTMNDDESTLTLSDKVLDRACLLTFPAPAKLDWTEQKRGFRRAKRLSWNAWSDWTRTPNSEGTTVKLNELNDTMRLVNRPFGHRLFRAIQAYIGAYPVAGESDAAWADQFAMKILPRLRGLECEDSTVAGALSRLESQVPVELQPSFRAARQREFFVWQGATELYQAGAAGGR